MVLLPRSWYNGTRSGCPAAWSSGTRTRKVRGWSSSSVTATLNDWPGAASGAGTLTATEPSSAGAEGATTMMVGSAARRYAGALIPIENGGVTGAKKASAIARSAAPCVPGDVAGSEQAA